MSGRHEPERRCLGCGRRAPQKELIRFQVDPDRDPPGVVAENGPRRRGRGAYVCPRQVCVDRTLRRRGFQRAFRRSVEVDASELYAAVRSWAERETGPMVGEG
jgi:predicted RNA-binding protein YlxR (DUF448 family)